MNPKLDKLPPHNESSEKGLIGCCVLDPKGIRAAFDAGIKPESFYVLKNRELWHVLRVMDAEGSPIDMVTVGQYLIQKGLVEQCGGFQYLSECVDCAPVASNIEYHLKLVIEKWILRMVAAAATKAANDAMESDVDPKVIIGELSQKLEDASVKETQESEGPTEVAQKCIDQLEERHRQRAAGVEITGIATGLRRLDSLSSGIPVGAMTVIGARPSVGKTAMLTTLVVNCCIDRGVKTTVFSLETTSEKLMYRMMANSCSIPASTFRDGSELTEREMQRLTVFMAKLSKSPLRFAKPLVDIDAICSVIGRHAEMGTKLFLIDYIQIVKESGSHDRKSYSVGSIATALKRAAIKWNVAVVVLAQLRKPESEDSLPTENDIADSDQIFRDADLMWLLHRPDRMAKPTESMVLVVKNKEGETSLVKTEYTPYFMRWEEFREKP